jgi:hypothetical protein
MKNLVCMIVSLALLSLAVPGLAAEAVMPPSTKEPVVKKISVVASSKKAAINGYETQVTVVQIDDEKNGVICYGLASESATAGRGVDGGYPGTAISCVKKGK